MDHVERNSPGNMKSPGQTYAVDKFAFPITILVISCFVALGVAFIELDHPFTLATFSRALYSDEAFYSDGARNFLIFGQWSFPYDYAHWPAAPLLTAIRIPAFALFGVSLETARITSMAFGFIGCLAFYATVRTHLRPVIAAALTIAGAVTFSFATYARSALADPTATALALVALLIYVRFSGQKWAVPTSLLFGFLAFFAKSYFVTAFLAIIALWTIDILVRPILDRAEISYRRIFTFFFSMLSIGAVYVSYHILFSEIVAEWSSSTLDNKLGHMHPITIFIYELRALKALPFTTKTHVFLLAIAVAVVFYLFSRLRPGKLSAIVNDWRQLSRAELAYVVWLCAGLAFLSLLKLQKEHYFFFLIFPICFLGASALVRLVPERLTLPAVMLLVVGHIAVQAPLYAQWWTRSPNNALFEGSRTVAGIIDNADPRNQVPVIGSMAATISFFSDRILAVEAAWMPNRKDLCAAVEHWRPPFHVATFFPKSQSYGMLDNVAGCNVVRSTEQVVDISLLPIRGDRLVLTRLYFHDE